MNTTRRIHLIFCLAALAAFLLPVAVASSGIMQCQEWAGKATLEFVCHHELCVAATVSDHDHDAGRCRYSVPPCNDKRLGVDTASFLRSTDRRVSSPDGTLVALVPARQAARNFSSLVLRGDPGMPALTHLLRRLRTVQLLV